MLLCVLVFLCTSGHLLAQPKCPDRPSEYDVRLSYRILALGQIHITLFDEMMNELKAAGLQLDPIDREDMDRLRSGEEIARLSGMLPTASIDDVLRIPHVRTLLLTPKGYRLPPAVDQRVLVDVRLAAVIGPGLQQRLWQQTRLRLAAYGRFTEKVGYDSRNYTRLFGTLPSAEVELLLEDLRLRSSGWLVPDVPAEELPMPLRAVSPLRVVEVIDVPLGVPESEDVPPLHGTKTGIEHLDKVSPELRAALESGKPQSRTERIEVVFLQEPTEGNGVLAGALATVPGAEVEGRLGQVVTFVAPAAAARAFAGLPTVATVRSPRWASLQLPTNASGGSATTLRAANLDRLHGLGYRGAGVCVAIIDTSFAGWESFVGRGLPKSTTLIDFTAARNYAITPDPDPGPEDNSTASGTAAALSAAAAAPEARLVLIRISPDAAYMLLDACRAIAGEAFQPDAVKARRRELSTDVDLLPAERERVLELRAKAQATFDLESVEAVRLRKDADEAADRLRAAEKLLTERLRRLARLQEDLKSLREVSVVACGVNWNEGYPLDTSSALSQYLSGRLAVRGHRGSDPVSWFQAVGDNRGQIWGGLYRDVDGSGTMEFAHPGERPPAGRWTTGLNFLKWWPLNSQTTTDLPSGIRVRVVLQWREVRDLGTFEPLGSQANLHILALRQRDPTGRQLCSDDLNVIARSAQGPLLVARTARTATFEQALEFDVPAPGGYAVRIEGSAQSVMQVSLPVSIPAMEAFWELQPRLIVTAIGRRDGHVILGDYQSDQGGPGMPADGVWVRTIGTSPTAGEPESRSVRGSYPGLGLMAKPTFTTINGVAISGGSFAGTGPSAALAAGTAASMLSAGAPKMTDWHWLAVPRGGLFQVPEAWLEQLARRARMAHPNDR
jgi:hypothetical protein